jgi:hypothetical protein
MFFLAGAASSVLDFLASLQDTSGAKQTSAAGAATPSPNPFELPALNTAASGAAPNAAPTNEEPAGNMTNCWSCPQTMSTLLSAQSQTTTAGGTGAGGTAAGGTTPEGTTSGAAGSAGIDVQNTIAQMLTALEDQVGAGQQTNGPDGSSGSMQGPQGAHHHRHARGIEQLLQAFDDPAGTNQSRTNSDGSITSPDAMNSLLMNSLLGPGPNFPFSLPFTAPSDGSGNLPGAPAFGLGAVNPLERLISLQARVLAATSAGRNLSMTA